MVVEQRWKRFASINLIQKEFNGGSDTSHYYIGAPHGFHLFIQWTEVFGTIGSGA